MHFATFSRPALRRVQPSVFAPESAGGAAILGAGWTGGRRQCSVGGGGQAEETGDLETVLRVERVCFLGRARIAGDIRAHAQREDVVGYRELRAGEARLLNGGPPATASVPAASATMTAPKNKPACERAARCSVLKLPDAHMMRAASVVSLVGSALKRTLRPSTCG
jgi:hypothetical protein